MSGKKKYDLRINDFDANVGDILVLEEWDPETKEYAGRKIEKKITYIGKFKVDDYFTNSKDEIMEKGFRIMSLE